MPNSPDFIAHVLELMRPTAPASSRPMFGGHGLYVDGKIVGIVVGDCVYFKTDDRNRAEFVLLGLEPFTYTGRAGTTMAMSYRRAPEEALESPEAMGRWLRSAMGAALRAVKAKPARTAPRPKAGNAGTGAATRWKPGLPKTPRQS